ncbi:hypothetical protein Tco_1339975 [Tanacetum coccineum]
MTLEEHPLDFGEKDFEFEESTWRRRGGDGRGCSGGSIGGVRGEVKKMNEVMKIGHRFKVERIDGSGKA